MSQNQKAQLVVGWGLSSRWMSWITSLSLFTFMHWRRKWQPTPVFLPGESQGQGSLVGCRLWGRTESVTTEATQQQHACTLQPGVPQTSSAFILAHTIPPHISSSPWIKCRTWNWVLAIAMWVEFLGESGARKDSKEHSHRNPPHTSARPALDSMGGSKCTKWLSLGAVFPAVGQP